MTKHECLNKGKIYKDVNQIHVEIQLNKRNNDVIPDAKVDV